MGLLEVAAADFGGGNLCCDREHRRSAAMGIEQAIDEVEVARPAGARAYRQPPGGLRLAGGGKGGDLLVPDVHPTDRLALAQRFRQAVQAVADDTEHALHAGLDQRFSNQVSNVVDWHGR